jgi:ABC-type microcin C transport system permease subunit YejB
MRQTQAPRMAKEGVGYAIVMFLFLLTLMLMFGGGGSLFP